MSEVDSESVMAWVGRYERAWREGDLTGVAHLFTEDARYRPSPYSESEVGHDAIKAFWLDDEGATFTVAAEPVAVQGRTAVVRVVVGYLTPRKQQYTDLWLVRFAADGRAEEFEEWAYWPGKAYSASHQGADD